MRPAVYDEWVLRVARVTAVLGASVIAVAASCFSKPGDPNFHGTTTGGDGGIDGPGDSGVDANGDAPMMTACLTDMFDTGAGCGAVGSEYGISGLVTRSNNQLSIAPPTAGGLAAGCRSTGVFSFAKGTSIKVAQISHSAMTNSTTFTVINGANTSQGMQVIFNDSGNSSIVYDVQCLGVTPAPTPVEQIYDPVTQLYWKFEVVSAALTMEVHAFYSGNGQTWTDTTLGCRWSSFSTVKVDLGVNPSATSPNLPALFDDFNVKTGCP